MKPLSTRTTHTSPISASSLTRRGLLAGAATVSAAAMVGCAAKTADPKASTEPGSTTSSGSKAPGGKETLSFLAFEGDFDKKELAAWEAANNVKISITLYTFDTLTAMLAANKAPDVVTGQGVPDAPYLFTKDIAEPLDDYLAKSSKLKTDNLTDINNVWRFDGKESGKGAYLGLVKDYSSDLCLWVNAELAGETPSSTEAWTYDKLREIAVKNTKVQGPRVLQYGYAYYNSAEPGTTLIMQMMATQGAKLFNDTLDQVDFTQAAGIKALQWYHDMWQAKAMSSPFAKSSADDYANFKAGKLATFQSGFWTQGMFADGKPEVLEKLYMIPAPTMGDKRVSPVVSGSGLWIPKQSKKKELAFKFFEDFFGGSFAENRATSGWGVPVLKSLQDKVPDKTTLNKRALATQREEDKYFEPLTFTPYAKQDALNLAINSGLEAGMKAKKDITTIAGDITKSINALLARGKR